MPTKEWMKKYEAVEGYAVLQGLLGYIFYRKGHWE